ncbi:MAG: DUF4139 domain-containing protein [Chitinophagaceae bacterium]|nr:DUF4139 domain-containing protein [Chitinophagaceae bacterium]MBP6417401.1 DUF4139 domain-containing protein [Chitinophagaceae bacterium]HQW44828.1 DUF4139 domain-containing protein [Chitinophagaceae bacterium]
MKKILLISGVVLFCTSSKAQDTARVDAAIKNATVYFGYGAELTHESKVKIDATTKIIVISQLSTSIDINSLQISVPEDVALLSQHYKVYYPAIPTVIKTKEVERLEDSIVLLQKEITRIDNLVAIDQEILAKTGLLIETTINTSGNKTITSEEVLKLLEYYNLKIEKSKTNIYNHKQNINLQNLKIADIRKRIAVMSVVAPNKQKPYGQVFLQVMCKRSGEIPVDLSYYTTQAGWTAVYDVRVNSKTNKVKLVYKASLTQTSGIDWKKTKLTLSTGTPNFGVAAPILTPWYLQLYVPGIYTELQRRAAQGNASRNVVQSYRDDRSLSEVVVSGTDGDYKQEKLKDQTIDPSTLQQYTTLNEGQLNTNFEIDLPYDIESDGQLHSVSIKDQEISCVLKNYAVPRIDKDAYLLAEVADWQNLDLLPGDANIIMDDTYIGKSVIDPNTTADTLNLSLGRDKRIAVKRSVVKELSSLKTSGKESRQIFTYEIIVKNNKLTDVNLLLKDQYPLSTIKEVEVKLEEDGAATVNPETGVLTWKIDLKPGESKKVRFTYSVKYPKDKKIVNLK